MILLQSDKLRPLMLDALRKRQVVEEAAAHVVASLVQASLRGVDSHGIALLPHYCRAVEAGRIKAAPDMKFDAGSSSVARLDADHAFGHHSGAVAMRRAVEMANSTGMGAVNVRNSTHFGAAAYFALLGADAGTIGMAFTNADALVKAHGSPLPYFGTNPICVTAPMAGEEPFCLDMATSNIAWNKVVGSRRRNLALPDNVAYDAAGVTTNDANLARSLRPIGDYKGFGLGMMVEILCGLLADGPVGRELLPMYSAPLSTRRHISHFFISLDVEKFVGRARFAARLREMADQIRALPKMDGVERVMVAGDPEKATSVARQSAGIPIDEPLFAEFLALSPAFEGARVA